MNFRRVTLASSWLSCAVLGLVLQHVQPVEAKSVTAAPVSRRFLLVFPASFGDNYLLQAKAEGKKGEGTGLPEGKGKSLVEKDCVTCHAASVWTKKRYAEDRWSSVMDDMVAKGLVASDEDIDTITKYLVANFGPPKSDSPAADAAPAPTK